LEKIPVESASYKGSETKWSEVRRHVKILHVNIRPDLCVTFEDCETVINPVLRAVVRRRLVETGSHIA
jgi:hypothetical protein